MNDTGKLTAQLHHLFSTQKFAVLSTTIQGRPYSNLVAFASAHDLKTIVFATTRATRKYANIQNDSHIALLVDNRSNTTADFSEAVAVTATGKAEEVSAGQREHVLALYLSKHPELREFILSPSCALLKITVETYYVVNRFQNVRELHIRS